MANASGCCFGGVGVGARTALLPPCIQRLATLALVVFAIRTCLDGAVTLTFVGRADSFPWFRQEQWGTVSHAHEVDAARMLRHWSYKSWRLV